LVLLKSYVAEHGWEDFRFTTRVETFHIGQWVNLRRMQYRRGTLPTWLAQELEAISGWSWDPVKEAHLRNLKLLRWYVSQHGWDRLTKKTVVEGVHLKAWVYSRKRAYVAGRLSAWLQTELEAIPGWSWDTGLKRKEQVALEMLQRFVVEYGWGEFSSSTKVNGVQIGRFVGKWRTARRRGQLERGIAEQLEAIPGWSWDSTYPREHHARAVALLRAYVAEHGWEKLSRTTRFREFHLGSWCDSRRVEYRKGKLADWLQRELEAIPGWRWRLNGRGTDPPGIKRRDQGGHRL
jgi:uncharacterized protein (DUF2132 family)